MKLCEVTRNELLTKAKNEDPAKFARRLNYVSSIKPLPAAKQVFLDTGTLTVPIKIKDYVVTIHISGILKEVSKELEKSGKKLPDRSMMYHILRKVVDTSNVYINCTCPDFQYRHNFWASKNDYKYGKPETRPANITNPNNKGSTCKHILAALVRPSQWLKYVAGWINTIVRAYIQNRVDIAAEESLRQLEQEKKVTKPEEVKGENTEQEVVDTESPESDSFTNDEVKIKDNEEEEN